MALHGRCAVGRRDGDKLHRGFAWGLLGLIVLHVGGVIFTSPQQRENLVRSMLNGEKRAPRDDDVV